jgi:Tfp pilus assembly protein PilO
MAFIETHKKYLTKAAIVWAACLVLFLLGYLVVLRPQNLKRKHLDGILTEKKQSFEAAQIAAQESTQTQLREQIRQLQERLHDFVIDFEDSANLTFDIGQIATEKNVASFSVKSKTSRAVPATAELKHLSEDHIDISFIAGFHQFATFVNSLERHRPVLFVNEFTITKSNKNSSVYEVTLDVAAFVKKQQDTQTADKQSPPPLSAQT